MSSFREMAGELAESLIRASDDRGLGMSSRHGIIIKLPGGLDLRYWMDRWDMVHEEPIRVPVAWNSHKGEVIFDFRGVQPGSSFPMLVPWQNWGKLHGDLVGAEGVAHLHSPERASLHVHRQIDISPLVRRIMRRQTAQGLYP